MVRRRANHSNCLVYLKVAILAFQEERNHHWLGHGLSSQRAACPEDALSVDWKPWTGSVPEYACSICSFINIKFCRASKEMLNP